MSMCLVSTQHTLRNSVGWVYIIFTVCRLNRVKVNGGPNGWYYWSCTTFNSDFSYCCYFLPICSEIRYLVNMPLFESWSMYLFETIYSHHLHASLRNFGILRQLKLCSFGNMVENQLCEWVVTVMQFTQFSSLVTVSFHSWNFCPKIHPTSCSSGYIWVKRSDVRGYRYTCSSSLKSTQPPFRRHLRRSTTKIRQIYAHCYIWSLQYFKWAVVFSGFDTWKIMWLMILG